MAKDVDYKQVILVRKDLKLGKGKLAAQVAHASLDITLKIAKYFPKEYLEWKEQGMKKVVLEVANEKELIEFKRKFENAGMKTKLVVDAGRTEIPAGTKTCLGVGPYPENKIDKISGKLKIL